MPSIHNPKVLNDKRKSLNDLKWESLKERGITPPTTEEERQKRLKEAHGY